MSKLYKAGSACLLAVSLIAASQSHAGIIDSNSTLLTEEHANQIEHWLGQGDLNWQSEWYGETGATTESWHSAVDNLGPTVSIYKIINSNNEEMLIGGYTTDSFGNNERFETDTRAFIFNLTTSEHQAVTGFGHAIYARDDNFATFGGGYDLYGGQDFIGNVQGYSTSYSYDTSQNNIIYANDTSLSREYFDVIALETFTFSASTNNSESSEGASVPTPATAGLLLTALGLLGTRKRKTDRDSHDK